MSAFAPLVGAKRNIDEHLSADDVRRMIDDARAKKDRDADKLGGNRKNSHRQKNPTPQHSRGELRVIGSSGRSRARFTPRVPAAGGLELVGVGVAISHRSTCRWLRRGGMDRWRNHRSSVTGISLVALRICSRPLTASAADTASALQLAISSRSQRLARARRTHPTSSPTIYSVSGRRSASGSIVSGAAAGRGDEGA